METTEFHIKIQIPCNVYLISGYNPEILHCVEMNNPQSLSFCTKQTTTLLLIKFLLLDEDSQLLTNTDTYFCSCLYEERLTAK